MYAFRTLTLGLSMVAILSLPACGDDETAGTGGSGATGNTGNTGGGTGNSGGTGNDGGGGAGNEGGGGGGNFDVPSCTEYCAAIDDACSGTPQYFDGSCEIICGAFAVGNSTDPEGADVTDGTNTLACRAYHVSVAATMEPELHCPHSGPVGEGLCSGTSEVAAFCELQAELCGTAQYDTEADCVADIATVPDTATYDTTHQADDTLACRTYHLTAAAVDPGVHCQHTGGPGATTGDSTVCIED